MSVSSVVSAVLGLSAVVAAVWVPVPRSWGCLGVPLLLLVLRFGFVVTTIAFLVGGTGGDIDLLAGEPELVGRAGVAFSAESGGFGASLSVCSDFLEII